MIWNADQGHGIHPSLSSRKHTYTSYYDPEKGIVEEEDYNTKIPVCYSTDALKWAQTAYFIAIVIV